MPLVSDERIRILNSSSAAAPVATSRGVRDVFERFRPRPHRATVRYNTISTEREIRQRMQARSHERVRLRGVRARYGRTVESRRVDGDDIVAESDVGRAPGLERDRVRAEVFEHVEDGLEPEVLNATLAFPVDRHTQVLQGKIGNI